MAVDRVQNIISEGATFFWVFHIFQEAGPHRYGCESGLAGTFNSPTGETILLPEERKGESFHVLRYFKCPMLKQLPSVVSLIIIYNSVCQVVDRQRKERRPSYVSPGPMISACIRALWGTTRARAGDSAREGPVLFNIVLD